MTENSQVIYHDTYDMSFQESDHNLKAECKFVCRHMLEIVAIRRSRKKNRFFDEFGRSKRQKIQISPIIEICNKFGFAVRLWLLSKFMVTHTVSISKSCKEWKCLKDSSEF